MECGDTDKIIEFHRSLQRTINLHQNINLDYIVPDSGDLHYVVCRPNISQLLLRNSLCNFEMLPFIILVDQTHICCQTFYDAGKS